MLIRCNYHVHIKKLLSKRKKKSISVKFVNYTVLPRTVLNVLGYTVRYETLQIIRDNILAQQSIYVMLCHLLLEFLLKKKDLKKNYLCNQQYQTKFGYLFSKYVPSEYIWIFVRYIMWHPTIFRYLIVSIFSYLVITAVVLHQAIQSTQQMARHYFLLLLVPGSSFLFLKKEKIYAESLE